MKSNTVTLESLHRNTQRTFMCIEPIEWAKQMSKLMYVGYTSAKMTEQKVDKRFEPVIFGESNI